MKRMHGIKTSLLVIILSGLLGFAISLPASGYHGSAGEFHKIQGKGVENLYELDAKLYSGASPEGDQGFETLKKLGIKTLISVDGSAPEVERAETFGMRYVHLPIGYDGTSRSNALRIIKAAAVMPGPIFVHCHHGTQRGPTAAALICEGLKGWSPEQGEAWLRAAGTATDFPGLYRIVREFNPPNEIELGKVPETFPSRAQTPELVNTMVEVDGHFDALKAMQKNGFKSIPGHPDATPATESLLLYELFREAHRTKQGARRGEQFIAALGAAEASAQNLHNSLKNLEAHPTENVAGVEMAFETMMKNCASCHKTYRN